jgi:hypothetical protein
VDIFFLHIVKKIGTSAIVEFIKNQDSHNFLIDPVAWDENFAEGMAYELGMNDGLAGSIILKRLTLSTRQ